MIRVDTDGFKEVFDAGRKLEPTAVGLQWVLMCALFFIALLTFCIIRPGNKTIYQPKVKYHVGNKSPPRISSSLFGWVPPLFFTKEIEVVHKSGVDAAVFLRFLRLLRWLFLMVSIIACGVLIPLDYLYNNGNRPQDRNILSVMSIRDIKGPMLYGHVGVTYFITIVVVVLVNHHWKAVLLLRAQWFYSAEYLHSFYARTICITQVHPRLQSDAGIHSILSSINMPYPATAVHIGRNVGKLPELIEYHNNTVRQLERVLVKYLRNGRIGKKRPTIRVGGCCCFGRRKKDAITFYTNKLRRTEATIHEYRSRIDTRQPTNYGFASLGAVPYAHIVAQSLSGKHPKGTDVDLAPNPRDIIWSNISESRGTMVWKKVIGFLWLAFICCLSLCPLFFAATLANLDVITETGYVPFLRTWSESSPWTYTIASATLPPLVAGITTFFLPRIMRWLSKYMGAFTRSHLDRAVIARYFAFLVISQLFIFTLIGVGYNVLLQLIDAIRTPGASVATVLAKFKEVPQSISRTYVNQAAYWLKWFPLRGFLTVVDLMQVPSLVWVPLKTHLFGRTPRDIREWTKPPTFLYAIYYSNFLFCAAVGLLFAPLAPLVALAAAIVLWTTSWVHKYQLIYTFATEIETGGRLWNVVINRLLASVVFMQLLMIFTIGLQYNFAILQTTLTVPPVFIILCYKVYINRVHLPRFKYFIPRQDDFARMSLYSANADAASHKLERRFGHPALHSELFTPMVHARMMPLLREVYKGRLEDKEEPLPAYRRGGVGRRGVGSSPSTMNDTQMLNDIQFSGIDQNDLEYDPALYARNYNEIDWETSSTALPPYEETRPQSTWMDSSYSAAPLNDGIIMEEQRTLLDQGVNIEYQPPGYHDPQYQRPSSSNRISYASQHGLPPGAAPARYENQNAIRYSTLVQNQTYPPSRG